MNKKRKKILIRWAVVIGVIAFLGWTFSGLLGNSSQRIVDQSEVITIESQTITLFALASGKISSSDQTEVTFNGTFRKSLVEIGDEVSNNQKIGEFLTVRGELWAIRARTNGLITAIPGGVSNRYIISNPEKLQVNVQITERDIHKVSIGQVATVFVEALNKTFQGQVTQINSVGNTSADFTTYTVTVGFDHGSESVFIGMSASARIEIESKSNIAVVPIEALITVGGKRYLLSAEWIDNPNNRQSDYYIEIQTGIADVFNIEVLGDNLIGKKIVILPQTASFPFFTGRP